METSTITKSKSKAVQSEYKRHPSGEYTANDMIGAWEKGYKEGREYILGDISKINDLANSALYVMQEFHADVLSKNGCKRVFLKVHPKSARFIVALDCDVYFDDKRCDPIYAGVSKIAKEHPICITFMPFEREDGINYAALDADGYVKII
ncbi:hypothetical protein Barb6XT_00160 [Bacteroidales bacterium Barb6XT]|nr:hypothetical protein Barb6XT_00160 [Bacteroidales bacterium Barb6XT]